MALLDRAAGCVGTRTECFIPQCAGCKRPLTIDRVVVGGPGGGAFHPNCIKCHECRKPLAREPFVVLEKNIRIHRACFFCHEPSCRTPLANQSHFRYQGMNLCRLHYENMAMPRCIKCNEPMCGEFMTFAQKACLPGLTDRQIKQMSKNWHRAEEGMCRQCCKCAECRTALMGKKFYEHDGKIYCEADYERLFAPKCKSCNRSVWGDFSIHESGEIYCNACAFKESKCFSCGRLVWPRRAKHEVLHPVDLPDGRVLCEFCAKDAVLSPSVAQECFGRAKHFVQQLLGRERSLIEHLTAKAHEISISSCQMDDIELTLIDRRELATTSLEHGIHQARDCSAHTQPMGITLLQRKVVANSPVFACFRDTTALGTTRLHTRPPEQVGAITSRTVTRACKGIRVLNGLPPMLLTATLVHELLHYHMFVIGKGRPLPPQVEEGICELAALLYLRSLPQDAERDLRIQQKLENSSAVYGCGLRAAERKWRALDRDIREESDAVEYAWSSFQKDGAVGRLGLHLVPNLQHSSGGALGRLDGKQELVREETMSQQNALRDETMSHSMKIENKLHHAFWHPRMPLKGPVKQQ